MDISVSYTHLDVYKRQIQIREVYGDRVHIFTNCIPLSVRAAETTAEGKSIYLHDPKGIVANGYYSLTEEVLEHEK